MSYLQKSQGKRQASGELVILRAFECLQREYRTDVWDHVKIFGSSDRNREPDVHHVKALQLVRLDPAEIQRLATLYDRWAHGWDIDSEPFKEAKRQFYVSVEELYSNDPASATISLHDFRRGVIAACKQWLLQESVSSLRRSDVFIEFVLRPLHLVVPPLLLGSVRLQAPEPSRPNASLVKFNPSDRILAKDALVVCKKGMTAGRRMCPAERAARRAGRAAIPENTPARPARANDRGGGAAGGDEPQKDCGAPRTSNFKPQTSNRSRNAAKHGS